MSVAQAGRADAVGPGPFRIAVDIGGTFVDAVALDESTGQVYVHKTSTTPDDPAVGVVDAVAGLPVPLRAATQFIHGTTLGLNAVLERRGAATGLITNAGFRDILEIGRGDVPETQMYDLQIVRPRPLIRRRHIATVTGRIDARGGIVDPLAEAEVRTAARYLIGTCGLVSVAVCFLHSYTNPVHEVRVREIVKEEFPSASVTLSCDVAREYREYERTSSTVIAAYIRPIVDSYLEKLESELRGRGFSGSFWIMRSSGGAMSAAFARDAPLASLFSGPAGGIAAAAYIGRETGHDRLISFDVGGTSLDACVIHDGGAAAAYEAKLEHMPMLAPVFDLRTIGAGGGSIARVDDGFLKVGPQSAGAVPGPACYLRGGTDATLTDAATVLGYLQPRTFLAGRMEISVPRAEEAIAASVAGPLGLPAGQAAAGVFDVAVSRTVGALREITIERGLDPRDFRLVAFGGFGPVLASMIMREMQVRSVLVPPAAGALSAWGMLVSDMQHDVSQTVLCPLDEANWAALEPVFAELEREARQTLQAQGVPEDEVVSRRLADLRYRRQEHTLTVTIPAGADVPAIRALLDAAHLSHYGHIISGHAEVVTLRVHVLGSGREPAQASSGGETAPEPEPDFTADAYDAASRTTGPHRFFTRAALRPGATMTGPLVVLEDTATTVVSSDQVLSVDEVANLVITQIGS
jgi:N-methylhydantoinase A